MSYASGKYALAVCDRCGQQYKYSQLREEVENGRRNGLRVGRDMVDPDHPQNHVGRIRPHDEQSIPDARPDVAETATTNTSFDNRIPHTAGTRS